MKYLSDECFIKLPWVRFTLKTSDSSFSYQGVCQELLMAGLCERKEKKSFMTMRFIEIEKWKFSKMILKKNSYYDIINVIKTIPLKGSTYFIVMIQTKGNTIQISFQ